MLKQLRNKKTAKKVWVVLAAIIVPAFVLWGAGSLVGDKQKSAFAGRLFGKKISQLEFKDALDAVKNQVVIQFGDNLPQAQKYLNLEAQAWVRLMLLHEAARRGMTASDKEVIETIENYPFFQRNGQFNNHIYTQMLEYSFRTLPRVFEEEVRQDIMIKRLYDEVTSGVNATDEEARAEYLRTNEQLSLSYIAAVPAEFSKAVTVTDDELKEYFRSNSLDFKKPLSFELSYISTEDESQIKKAALLLAKKNDLQKTAKSLDLSVKDTGLFTQTGPIPGIGWSNQIIELVSRLKTGQYCAPLRLDKYYYILMLKERKEPYVPEFETIKSEVKEAFIRSKGEELARAKIDDCLKKLEEAYKTDPKTPAFEKIADACGLKSGTTALFKYGSYIDNIGGSDVFFEAASKLNDGQFSPVITLPSGFYIIKVKYRAPFDENKFAAEKQDFSRKVLLQKKQEYFNNFVEELKRKA
ncbi:MAG: peptidylprolyl isomerase [Candidatus Omnitrophota bacterium]|nr:peptidylprolyl isomerase [Candidatus Omnitrophota bacterium]